MDFLGEDYYQTTDTPFPRTTDDQGRPTGDSSASTVAVNGTSTPRADSSTDQPVPWTIQQTDRDGDGVSDELRGRWKQQRACGLQLYPGEWTSTSPALFWGMAAMRPAASVWPASFPKK